MRLSPIIALVLVGAPLAAQTPLTGFAPSTAQRERTLETLLQSIPDTASARKHVRTLSAEAHVAGSPAQTKTADYVLRQMASWGLDTARVAFKVYMPYPESTLVERMKPTRIRFKLDEPALKEDPTTQGKIFPALNGYSGSGDVTAPVVYVNYGLIEDYAVLDSLGISVKGKVAIARYGRSFRGIKAREAEKHGAAALLIYSDPGDDGYARGDTYPVGPMRHPDAPQRGSIFNGNGDPATPGWASTADAKRLPLDSMNVSRIPVVPIGYANAARLLEGLKGRDIPAQTWQGGLPFRYHLGGGPEVTTRVAVWQQQGEKANKIIYNTIGTLRGSDWPDELVITGGHRDGWGPGATDNVSGVTTILESARAWAEAAKKGMRPRRTILFATWDAEEWGLVGSSEWAELMEKEMKAKAVAYLNQDVSASGRSFGGGGTASLQPFLREATRSVTQPGDTVTVYDAWRRGGRRGGPAAPGTEPTMGDLGGGSDFAGLYNHLGVPAFDFGFGGAGGVYHSAYDTYTFVERFADPGYLSHAASGRLNAVLLARLANADVVPLDYANFGQYLKPLVERTRAYAKEQGVTVDLAPLDAAVGRLADAGLAFNAARDAKLTAGPDQTKLAEANRLLRGVEQEMTRPEGLKGRPWMRNLIFAADRDNGYANVALPGIAEAIRDHDAAGAAAEAQDLATRVDAAAKRVTAAKDAL